MSGFHWYKNVSKTYFGIPFELTRIINDDLFRANLYDVSYFYRVKTSESILDKVERFKQRSEGYPVNYPWELQIWDKKMPKKYSKSYQT